MEEEHVVRRSWPLTVGRDVERAYTDTKAIHGFGEQPSHVSHCIYEWTKNLATGSRIASRDDSLGTVGGKDSGRLANTTNKTNTSEQVGSEVRS